MKNSHLSCNNIPIVYDDIVFSLQRAGGISVVFVELYKLINTNTTHYLYTSAKNNFFYEEKLFPNKKVFNDSLISLRRYFNPLINEKNPFIFHSTYYRTCCNKNAVNITTVHDFTYEYYRKDFKSKLHKWQKKNAILHSDGVICISENTKRDLLKFYPKFKGIIKVIYNGYNTQKYIYKQEISKTKNVLFVGARTDYKRFDLAVEICKKLEDVKLLIVGGGNLSSSESTLLNEKLPNRFEKLGFLTDDELCDLYNSAFFLCYPSEYEGFGIPVLEAQACGCPVVCQNKSSIPEVALDSALYINSDNLKESLVNIKKLYEPFFYESIKNKGLENAKRFSWEKCAKETYEFYEEIYSKKTGIEN